MKKFVSGIVVIGMLVGVGACAKKAPVVDPVMEVVQHQLDRANQVVTEATKYLAQAELVEGQLYADKLVPESIHALIQADFAKADKAIVDIRVHLPSDVAGLKADLMKAAHDALVSVVNKLNGSNDPQLRLLASILQTIAAFANVSV